MTALKAMDNRQDACNLSVLVVEDDAFQARTLALQLRQLGIADVTTASDGTQAMAILEARRGEIDIAICDLHMDGMDGIEFVRHVSHGRIRGLILTTALAGDLLLSVEKMARQYGAPLLGCIAKPIERKRLERMFADYRARSEPQHAQPACAPAQWTARQLIEAMRTGQIAAYFQPKVSLQTGATVGAEALVRWVHPRQGVLGPAHFLDAMGKYGLDEDLTFFMLDQCASALERWKAAGHVLTVSVNATQETLQRDGVVENVCDCIRRHGLRPEQLTLEITETALADNRAGLLETVTRLRMAGIGISIDDFGTGYSSMRLLSEVPFTELKIDRSFVAEAHLAPKYRAILESTLHLARAIGLNSVAEGIETPEDLKLVASLGCEMAQGYYLCRPLTADRMQAWLAAGGAAGAEGLPAITPQAA